MNQITLGAALLAALLGTGTAGAQSVYGQVGTTGGTLGYVQHMDSFNLRGDLNFADYSRNFHAAAWTTAPS